MIHISSKSNVVVAILLLLNLTTLNATFATQPKKQKIIFVKEDTLNELSLIIDKEQQEEEQQKEKTVLIKEDNPMELLPVLAENQQHHLLSKKEKNILKVGFSISGCFVGFSLIRAGISTNNMSFVVMGLSGGLAMLRAATALDNLTTAKRLQIYGLLCIAACTALNGLSEPTLDLTNEL